MSSSVTVILTAYKRQYFGRQLPAIEAQTIQPARVVIWQNANHVAVEPEKGRFELIQSERNYRFHGRFTLPLLLETEYVAIFDDDCIPGRRWLENCLRCCRERGGIAGANGKTVNPSTLAQASAGAGKPVPEDLEVDFVGHSWFFRREWIHHMWAMAPPSFESGEDIHLAAACKIRAGIPCYVPRQRAKEPESFGDRHNDLGRDRHASYRTQPSHFKVRKELIRYWVGQGWELIGARGRRLPARSTARDEVPNRFFLPSDPHQQEIDGHSVYRNKYWWSRPYEYLWALDQLQGRVVLDAGCGIEHPFKYLLASRTERVVAVDRDECLKDLAHPGIEFRCGSVAATPFLKDGELDQVFCISVLEHLGPEDRLSALREWRRTLRPAGTVVLTVDHPRVEPRALIQDAAACGFKLRGDFEVTVGPHDLRFERHPGYFLRVWRCVLESP